MVSIQVHESTAAALAAQANSHGISIDEYLSRVAQADIIVPRLRLSAEEIERELNDLSLDVPPLPQDFSRADIYLDHD